MVLVYLYLNDSLVQFEIFHSKLSIKESMAPYYGYHSTKMFITGKPIPYG